jgi:hypothetical protein
VVGISHHILNIVLSMLLFRTKELIDLALRYIMAAGIHVLSQFHSFF